MANAEKHKKRSQYRHFKTIPHNVFFWNALRREQIREARIPKIMMENPNEYKDQKQKD